MAILIKGMKMPSKGCKTINLHADGTVYVHGVYPTELYKAIPVPTPHGRLIDEKWIKEYITDTTEGFEELIMNRNDLQYYSLIAGLRTVEVMIEHAPTVIEAEEGKE